VEGGHWEYFDNAVQSAPWNDVDDDTEVDEYFPQHHARTWVTKCQAFQSLYLESEFIPTGCERLAGWMLNYLAAAVQPHAAPQVVAPPAPVAAGPDPNQAAPAQPAPANPPVVAVPPPPAQPAAGAAGRGNQGRGRKNAGRGQQQTTDSSTRLAAVPAVANPRASSKPTSFSEHAVVDINVYTRAPTSDDWQQYVCDPQTLPKNKAHRYLHMGRDKLSEHANSFDLGKTVWVVGAGGSHETMFLRETTVFFCPSEHTVPGGDSNKAAHMHEVLTILPKVEMSRSEILGHKASVYKQRMVVQLMSLTPPWT